MKHFKGARIVSFILFLLLLVECYLAAPLKVLDESFKYPIILKGQDYFYVIDLVSCKVYTYSATDFRKIAEFGRKGEGPGEFKGVNVVTPVDHSLYLSDYPFLTRFSYDGQVQKIYKNQTSAGSFIPFGKKFVGIKYLDNPRAKLNKESYILFDSDLEEEKELLTVDLYSFSKYNHSTNKTDIPFTRECIKAVAYQDRLYIANSNKGFFFSVYNQDGDKLFDISRPYKKIAISSEFKEKTITRTRRETTEEKWKAYLMEYNPVFAEYHEVFVNFAVDNHKIYVFKPVIDYEKNIQEVVILDMQGKLLSEKTIPIVDNQGIHAGYRWELCLKDGQLYFIVFNDETENWEIHGLAID